MPRIALSFIVLIAAINLASCGVVDTMVDGFKHVKAIEADLEKSVGIKPQVGFNWNNGQLVNVTVTFPQLYEAKPLRELAETVRLSVTSEFNQVPNNIVMAFVLGKAPSGTGAKLRDLRENTAEAAL